MTTVPRATNTTLTTLTTLTTSPRGHCRPWNRRRPRGSNRLLARSLMPAAGRYRPRLTGWIGPAARGAAAVGAGVVLGSLGGGLMGVAAGQLMATEPFTASVMILGGAGEGAFAGLLVAGLALTLAPPHP